MVGVFTDFDRDFTAKTHRRDAESAEFYTNYYNLCALCVSAVK